MSTSIIWVTNDLFNPIQHQKTLYIEVHTQLHPATGVYYILPLALIWGIFIVVPLLPISSNWLNYLDWSLKITDEEYPII